MNWIKNNINWLYLIGVILTFASSFLFTRHGFDWLDFTETGGIGSTVGGITTPFVGLITITLLSLTIKEQLNFNITQQK